jgi:hypothetical protein
LVRWYVCKQDNHRSGHILVRSGWLNFTLSLWLTFKLTITLTIRYAEGVTSYARTSHEITIYDISGREVFSAVTAPSVTEENKKIVTGGAATAERTLTWDASDIPAGVYFVRLQSGAEVVTKKVILMR